MVENREPRDDACLRRTRHADVDAEPFAGILADVVSITAAIWVVAALTAASGFVVLLRMYETHPRRLGPTTRTPPPAALSEV